MRENIVVASSQHLMCCQNDTQTTLTLTHMWFVSFTCDSFRIFRFRYSHEWWQQDLEYRCNSTNIGHHSCICSSTLNTKENAFNTSKSLYFSLPAPCSIFVHTSLFFSFRLWLSNPFTASTYIRMQRTKSNCIQPENTNSFLSDFQDFATCCSLIDYVGFAFLQE